VFLTQVESYDRKETIVAMGRENTKGGDFMPQAVKGCEREKGGRFTRPMS